MSGLVRKLILENSQSPGDIVMLTAALRDLHRCYPGTFQTDVRTPYPQLWENNPFLTPLRESDPGVGVIQCHYPLIQQSNQAPYHFIHGFIQFLNQRLGLSIRPTAFKGDIHLSKEEMEGPSPLSELSSSRREEAHSERVGDQSLVTSAATGDDRPHPGPLPQERGAGRPALVNSERSGVHDARAKFLPLPGGGGRGEGELPVWLICAGGKRDFTIKWWEGARYQAVVDHFRGRIRFVQVGAASDHHFDLTGVLDLRGKSDMRQLIRLVYHCDGVVCPVTLLMHLAAAVPVNRMRVAGFRTQDGMSFLRPCVVIAGGREPAHWEEYPGHQFIHTIGALPCCASGGCWRSRTVPLGDGDPKDRPESLCVDVVGNLPRCMDLIRAEEVIRRIELYLEGSRPARNAVNYDRPHPGPLPQEREKGRPALVDSGRNGVPIARLLSPSLSSIRNGGEGARRAGEEEHNGEPLAVHNACARAEAFIETIPEYPKDFAGRGIVICGGGRKYFPCAWVCIQMLRRLGCTLPIQLWHLGAEEMDEEMKALVIPLGVECVDGWEVAASRDSPLTRPAGTLSTSEGERDGVRGPRLHGWSLKPFAILHCPFQEVLLLDADNVPVVNPEFLFDSPQFTAKGAIFWPDFGRLGPWRAIWKICGVKYRDEPEFESGQILVDKARCWKPLNLAMWYNEQSEFFYQHIHGDKDTFHLAFRKLNQSYTMPGRGVNWLENVGMRQHDFEGRRIFQHRNLDKWRVDGTNRRGRDFAYEEECMAELEVLRGRWQRAAHAAPV